jgi:iron complex outermembrane receptor protein
MNRAVLSAALLTGASVLVLARAAYAQDVAPAAAPAGDQVQVEEVVVTGSRIVRNGYTAPTPVTVMATDQLQKSAPGSIPDGLNQLPQFVGSSSTQNTGNQATRPAAGNYLNLRGLGSIRNLVLLDGQRLPPTSFDGTVDTNIIPQALIQRVDIVTGGASAAYGSDAVSGVINFILDTKFNGLKGTLSAGVSDRGDAQSRKVSLAAGSRFAGGRGHVLLSYDHYDIDSIKDNFQRPMGRRLITRVGAGTAANPYVDKEDVRYATGTYGTLISAGSSNVGNPLRNYMFLPSGEAVPFNPGTTTGTNSYNIGGDGVPSIGHTLTGSQRTDQLFSRVDFELTPNIAAFAQLSYSESQNSFVTIGSGTQLGDFQIFTDNAFLPTAVRGTMEAAGFRSFVAGRIEADQPPKRLTSLNDVYVFLTGLRGSISKFNWRLDYSHGDTLLRARHEGNFDNQRWYAALDAVRGPQGNIVCRVTVTNPGLMDGCVPINIFGNGSPSKAAYDYVSQVSQYQVHQKMDILDANVSGEVFNLPAGPVSVAVGGEYRSQTLDETSNSDPSRPIDLTGLRTNVGTFILKYNSTNVGQAFGKQNVKEGYVETIVPILKDLPFVKTLDLNAAGRYTDYSTSGSVETWKVGLSYAPTDDLRLRATRSRDIRAPTLYELFAGKQAARGGFTDLHTNLNQNLITYSQGNVDLKPEIGKTTAVGVVWQPSFLSGFSASVDYFDVAISDAIGTMSTDDIQHQCEDSGGAASVCQFIIRPLAFSDRTAANFPTAILSVPINQARQYLHGIDYDVSYRLPVSRLLESSTAMVDLRVIGTYLASYKSLTQAGGVITQSNDSGNNLKNRINVQVGYTDGPLSIDVQARYLGKGRRTQTPTIFYVDNTVPAVTYVNATVTYKVEVLGRALDTFVTVNNLLDKQPPIIGNGQPGQQYPTNQAIYDVVGRYYTTGVRFKF